MDIMDIMTLDHTQLYNRFEPQKLKIKRIWKVMEHGPEVLDSNMSPSP